VLAQSWGSGEPIDWYIAQHFDPSDLEDYAGFAITKINFAPLDTADFTIKVWLGKSTQPYLPAGAYIF